MFPHATMMNRAQDGRLISRAPFALIDQQRSPLFANILPAYRLSVAPVEGAIDGPRMELLAHVQRMRRRMRQAPERRRRRRVCLVARARHAVLVQPIAERAVHRAARVRADVLLGKVAVVVRRRLGPSRHGERARRRVPSVRRQTGEQSSRCRIHSRRHLVVVRVHLHRRRMSVVLDGRRRRRRRLVLQPMVPPVVDVVVRRVNDGVRRRRELTGRRLVIRWRPTAALHRWTG